MLLLPPRSTLFPYTTLFRSATSEAQMKPYTNPIPGTAVQFAMVPIRGGEFAMGSPEDRKSTRLNSSHRTISYAVFCLKKKNKSKVYIYHVRELSKRKRCI